MEVAVRRQVIANTMTHGTADACIALELDRPQPEVMGFPGIAMKSAPGQYAITLLSQTNLRDQPSRDIQLRQLDYLASQGLFTVADSSVTTDDGTHPARSYQMTWAGFSAIRQNSGNPLCLPCGRKELAGIEKIEKLLEKVLDLEVYEVSYVSRVADVPAWASTAEASRLFPKLPQLIAESRGKAKVIRAKEGWRSAYEVEMEAAQATRGSATSNSLKWLMNLERSAPTLSEAKDLVLAQTSDTKRTSRHGMACLPLNIQRGGDDRIKSGDKRDDRTAFTVTYYDRGDRKEYEYKTMAKALHALSALEGAGLAQMEQLKPLPLPEEMANKDASPYSMYNAGIRYHVSQEAVEALGLSGGGCAPAGRLNVDVLAVHSNRGEVQIAARGIIEQTPEWVAKISERLPALKSMIETGLPLSGRMVLTAEDGEDKWRLGLSPRYPEASYNAIPAHLIPLMPLTAAAFPVKMAKAPALVQQQAFIPMERVQPPAGSSSAPQAPPRDAASMNAPRPIPSSSPVSNQPPYPANDAPVHVISIYQGSLPEGETRDFRQHPEGVVNLAVSEPNAVLLLFAYEPVEWHIKATNGITLKQVIAIGYYEQRVTFDGGGKPQVVTSRDRGILRRSGVDLRNGFPTRRDANDLVDIAAVSRALTGALPCSYQGKDDISATGFTIGPQTQRFALPVRKTPDSGGNTVRLLGEAVEGTRLLRGAGGARTNAWSDRIYSGGKIYYEGKMRVTGSLTAHTHANIGLCLARGETIEASLPGGALVIHHDEQKLYKDGDIFGIAADLDQQRLYYHVNGVWATGTPGSGNGIPLVEGKEYRACLFASGTASSKVQRGVARSDTTWEVNFGERPFSKTIPSGYVPFQGK
jgi:hypothetical protein